MAGNYGVDCKESPTPFSAVSTYELAGKLTYAVGRARISLLAITDQHQRRKIVAEVRSISASISRLSRSR